MPQIIIYLGIVKLLLAFVGYSQYFHSFTKRIII